MTLLRQNDGAEGKGTALLNRACFLLSHVHLLRNLNAGAGALDGFVVECRRAYGTQGGEIAKLYGAALSTAGGHLGIRVLCPSLPLGNTINDHQCCNSLRREKGS